MTNSDDRRMAVASRTLRRRCGITQSGAVLDGRSRRLVMAIENGSAGSARLEDLRAHFAQFDARLRVTVYWNGAALDRTIDERHALVTETTIRELTAYNWLTLSEVTFSKFGERGSIDVFGTNERVKAVFVGEVKSEWGSVEETNRSLDIKARLAPTICFERFGWRPSAVAKVLIFPEDGASRRIAGRYRDTLTAVYPARSREIRHWLKTPSGNLRGLWFLSNVTGS